MNANSHRHQKESVSLCCWCFRWPWRKKKEIGHLRRFCSGSIKLIFVHQFDLLLVFGPDEQETPVMHNLVFNLIVFIYLKQIQNTLGQHLLSGCSISPRPILPDESTYRFPKRGVMSYVTSCQNIVSSLHICFLNLIYFSERSPLDSKYGLVLRELMKINACVFSADFFFCRRYFFWVVYSVLT